MERVLFRDDLYLIPDKVFPLMVLSDNIFSFISLRIKQHQHGFYNHFMWMHRPGYCATQDKWFREVPIGKYLEGRHRLKLWYCPSWTAHQRATIIAAIKSDLAKPWYRTRYDVLQIVGIRVGLRWINMPGIDICSDDIAFIRPEEPEYDLKEHPSPPEINRWLQTKTKYKVYGRYFPD